jgi:hypothetical protein
MVRLYYIFWVSALFLLGGCAAEKPALRYSPAFLAEETATARPAGMVFDPPYLAESDAFGESRVAGVNLNTRRTFESTAGYTEGGEFVSYRLYYRDQQGSPYWHWNRVPGYVDTGVYRAFYYTRTGQEAR